MRVFIAAPNKEEGRAAAEEARHEFGDNTWFDAYVVDGVKPLDELRGIVEALSAVEIVLFARGWRQSRECRMVWTICQEYGIRTRAIV